MMRELRKPAEIDGDDDATEMVRFWLAHGKSHVALLLGMYEDSNDENSADELWAWGNILSDIAQHVANGMSQSHGYGFDESIQLLARYFISAMKERAPGLEGVYVDDA
jgi:hypothetical protein